MAKTVRGVLHLFSETGTEGGWWAIMNENFITPADDEPSNKRCKRCHRWWGDANTTPEPKPSFTYYVPDGVVDGVTYVGGYRTSDVPIEGGQTTYGSEPEGSFNDEFTKRSNAASLKCFEKGHQWEWVDPHPKWSYEGLVTLKSGDVLEVLDPENPSKVQECIVVDLIDNGDQYGPNAVNADGWVIHNYPNPHTIDFEKWKLYFREQYSAILTREEG